MIAELLSADFYAAGKYTGNIIMFPCSTSTCLQGVVALGPMAIAFLIVSPNLVVIYCLILKLFIHKLGLCLSVCARPVSSVWPTDTVSH